jgi:hypothetical protein
VFSFLLKRWVKAHQLFLEAKIAILDKTTDEVTKTKYETSLEESIETLLDRIRSFKHKPQPALRAMRKRREA